MNHRIKNLEDALDLIEREDLIEMTLKDYYRIKSKMNIFNNMLKHYGWDDSDENLRHS
jgi:hypothetical protein